ncbi:radical SAM domain protein [Treponema primitia ZAS-2]|uniref:Radical SAM domain protein n=1 Tax=Treponema primitia (strain ATCC BAA-887 / DSM 12427 / ZAS-2) TaxID=545694 RepID=F5YJ54_TREPZ|nr:radical SAM protein [Treponema primitia]AEF84373.1 radical SAM domain protein [Treponema primitia ZAS-2]
MSDLKEALYDELKLKFALSLEGVRYDEGTFDKLIGQNAYLKKREICTWDKDLVTKKSYVLPYAVTLPLGFQVGVVTDKHSPYKISEKDGVFSLSYFEEWIANLNFPKAPAYYSKFTSDGTPMREVAGDTSGGSEDKAIAIAYSTECALKEKGKFCLFCTFGQSKGLDKNEEIPPFRNPLQIAETVEAAYSEGFRHLTVTGGFIPERREVEYYLDVAEAIKDRLGVDDFNGTACIGAPQDIHVIDKYKEAGFSTIAFNIEVWTKQYFDLVCPGKVEMCGDFDHWIKTIEYAISVFGKGKVRSCFVVGLQPKDVLFQGLEYLASIGVVTAASSWVPAIGSPLEGFRSPTVDWHWDIQLQHTKLLQKYGRTYEELFSANAARSLTAEMYQIESEDLPIFRQQKIAI